MANNNNNNKIWSTEEIIENADNWSLAGDVALLNAIKAFSDRLLDQTVKTSGNIDNLLNNLNDVSLKLDLTKNKFQSLRNTQFIESRVYEDDETLDSKDENGTKIDDDKPPSEEDKDRILRESITRGLAVMNTYFDKVEVSVSDSEEDSDKSYVLQPKHLYADRPLPFLIGSEQWYKKWHVGLMQSSSESESEKEVEDVYSDSDSEDYLPKDTIMGSETSSELSFSNTQNSNDGLPANSTFNDSVTQKNRRDDFPSSDSTSSEYTNSLHSTRAPISNQQFVEQLAQKLGTVVNDQENNTVHVNRNPIRTATNTNRFGGGLFSDEPPPLDDFGDKISSKNDNSGLFSGGTDLFDKEDEDEDLFWEQQTKNAEHKSSPDVKTVKENQNQAVKNVNLSKSAQLSKGLFDSESSSEEDIFSTYKKQQTPKPFLQPFSKTTVPIFDDKPPELEPAKQASDSLPSKKKPIGGVSIFGDADIFASKKPSEKEINKSSNSNVSDKNQLPNKNETVVNTQQSQNANTCPESSSVAKTSGKKITSLFSDSDNEDDFKSNVLDTKKATSIFDSSVINKDSEKPAGSTTKGNGKNKTLNLFVDSDDSDSTIPSKPSASDDIKPKNRNIEVDQKPSDDTHIKKSDNLQKPSTNTTKKVSLFDDIDDLFKSDYDDIFSVDKSITKRFTSSLFDDLEGSGGSDVFGIKKSDSSTSNLDKSKSDSDGEKVNKSDENITETIGDSQSKIAKKVSLFESSGSDGESFLESDILGSKKIGNVKESAILEGINQKLDDNNVNEQSKKYESNMFNKSEDVKIILSPENTTESLEKESKEAPAISKTVDSDGQFEKLPEDSIETVTQSRREDLQPIDHEKSILNTHTVVASDSDVRDNVKPDIKVTEATLRTDESFLEPKVQVSRPVSLFDPTPPPYDDWDAKSDMSDIDDQFSYNEDISNTHGSSIFDNEPPLLHRNDDTSGILVDQNITRVESDDSSFYPGASSSRRLSSDIFSEEQSNDNLFVTKNKTEILPSGHLQSIPESTRVLENTKGSTSTADMYVDITPSGDAVDFLDSTTMSLENSVFVSKQDTSKLDYNIKQEKQPTKKKISLFDSDQEDTENYDDLFSTPNVSQNTETDLRKNQLDYLFRDVSSKPDNKTRTEKPTGDVVGFGDQTKYSKHIVLSGDKTEDIKDVVGSEGNTKDSKYVAGSGDKTKDSEDVAGYGGNTKASKDVVSSGDKTKDSEDEAGSGGNTKESKDVVGSGDKTKYSKEGNESVQSNQGSSDVKEEKDEEKTENASQLQRSASTSKVANLAEKLQSSSSARENEKKEFKATGSPGKLKHNLNINVNALMPGVGPPKLRNTEKSHSLDSGRDKNDTEVTTSSSSDVSYSTPAPNLRSKDPSSQQEKPVDFDDGADVEVLQSVTKDRVNIPIKRRPSTRKARQENLKKSAPDLTLYANTDSDRQALTIESKPEPFDSKPKTIVNAPQKTEEVIIKEQHSVVEKMDTLEKEHNIETKEDKTTQDEFNVSSDDDTDLFGARSAKKQKTVAQKQTQKTKLSLFSDGPDSDDDGLLFGGKKTKEPALPTADNKSTRDKKVKKQSKSLFGDDGSSDDDDMFQSGGSFSRQKGLVSKPVERKAFKTSTVKKLQNTEADDDPLSSLLK